MTKSGQSRRDRAWVLGALILLAALAWAYTINLGLRAALNPMSGGVAMPLAMPWTPVDFAFMFMMWSVMMFAMMLPSVTPTVMIFDRVRAKRAEAGRPSASTAGFVSGYLLAWVGFSLAATLLNWWLHANGALTSMMGRVAPEIGGFLLILAGLFQWTPVKDACLAHCRSPLGFLTTHWREGTSGALRMGLHHGAFCLGCCWILMLLLFVLGVMNLLWVAVLAIVVLAEKILPHGRYLSRATGIGLIVWGGWMMAAI